MRSDLTKYGIEETRTSADVDRFVGAEGTALMIVNSVCGCAAGKARPGVGMALQHGARPDRVATVFAGADEQAVARVRELAAPMPPSSPSILLFRNGKLEHIIHRRDIEQRQAPEIAQLLMQVFERHCAAQAK